MVAVKFPVDIPEDSPFGVTNVPFGIFSAHDETCLGERPRVGVAVGDYVLELHEMAKYGLFNGLSGRADGLESAFLEPVLNKFATMGGEIRRQVRAAVIDHLSNPESALFTKEALNRNAFVLRKDAKMHMPMQITNYTDSFSSLVHAENSLLPLGLALPSAFKHYPMGYNGRISSLRVSGTPIPRPSGFYLSTPSSTVPTYQLTQQLDFEIEIGAFISRPVPFGTSVDAISAAKEHIFGYVLHNDWSARDIQKYEMPPLGPMHSKGFITTLSPWVVVPEALKASRAEKLPESMNGDIHKALRTDEVNHEVYDIEFTALVSRNSCKPVPLVRTNFSHAFWTIPQMIAYQSSSGHGISTGDLIASGTISSPPPEVKNGVGTYGCLLEALAQEHVLPDVGGKPMEWLEDGDEFTIEGTFVGEGGRKVGFGGLGGRVVPGGGWT